VPRQAGNNHPTSIPTGVFKTADGHINIATTGHKTWERLCRALEAMELMTRPEYESAAARLENRDALNAEIDRFTTARTTAEWVERLNAAGVPCGPIYSIDQVFDDPQVQHLGVVESVATPDAKRALSLLAQPVRLSRTPSKIAAPTPEQGEHTDQVLNEFGFSTGEIAALRRAKVI
jgi:formyl-CoA transferase